MQDIRRRCWGSDCTAAGRTALAVVWLCALLVGAVLAPSPAALAADTDLRQQVDFAVARVYPALVQIRVVTVDYDEGREVKFEAAGSGAIISPEGHVITNHHVVGKAKRIRCVLPDKRELEATLTGTDPLADIAVVQLDRRSLANPAEKLPVAQFGDSDKLRLGDQVLAMGCPVALSQSVTLGIVSNLEMTMPDLFWPFTLKMDGEEVGTLVRWIGHDAAIYGGNSGGPLVDLKGCIVGINEIGLGLAGAIPGNLAQEVAQQIIRDGQVRRSWTGWTCQPLLRGSGQAAGALISEVLKDSPAEQAGIRPGDILLAYNGESVTVKHPAQLPGLNRRVLATPIGAKVPVELLRGKEKVQATVTTAVREKARGQDLELIEWGLTARQLTTLAAQELKRADKAGALVFSVRPGGPAGEAKPALQGQDVIVSLNGEPVRDLAHLVELTAALVKDQSKPVRALTGFERKGERMLTVVKVGLPPDEEKPGEVKKAWLSAAYQVLTADLAEALNLKGSPGVRLTQVFPGGAAEQAGLQVGDLITHLDGERIQASQPEDIEVFAQMLRQYKPGSDAELTVRRGKDNATIKVTVKLGGRPTAAGELKHYKDPHFGFEVRDVAYLDRIKERWPEGQGGALVQAVPPGGWAALAHLAVGDLILNVDGADVPNVAALETRMKAVAESQPPHVIFFVRRGIHTLFVELEPAWKAK